MALRTLDDFNLKNKNILIRVDMNVPIHNGQVTDSTRLSRAVPTILEVLEMMMTAEQVVVVLMCLLDLVQLGHNKLN